MKPPRLDYVRAATLAEAHAVLAAEGADARIIAGGQTLVPMLSMRLARPRVLVDIMRLGELRGTHETASDICVGAAVRQAELLAWPQLAARQPMLAAALPWVGHAQTRNRGTVCGSIAHADPALSSRWSWSPSGAASRCRPGGGDEPWPPPSSFRGSCPPPGAMTS